MVYILTCNMPEVNRSNAMLMFTFHLIPVIPGVTESMWGVPAIAQRQAAAASERLPIRQQDSKPCRLAA